MEIAKQASQDFIPLDSLEENLQAKILVQLTGMRVIRTKSGQQMAFLNVTDTKKKFDVTIFPETFSKYRESLTEGGYYYLTGKIQNREGRLQMVLNQVQEVTTERLWLLLESHQNDREISEILSQYPGNFGVVLHYQDSKQTIQLKNITVDKTPELLKKLQEYVLKTVFR